MTPSGVKVPGGQFSQRFLSTSYFPGPHFSHSEYPVPCAIVPGGHFWHSSIFPTPKGEKVPLGQRIHLVPSSLYHPGSHLKQFLLPEFEVNWPGGHDRQPARPLAALGAKVPAGHDLQFFDSSSYCPASHLVTHEPSGQATHSEAVWAPSFEVVLAGQAKQLFPSEP